ncbi:MAG: Ig-like domain-containing protein [Bacteroidales bacterium]|nr:Ig-like domain-containing protein [Bacteroidales bacterium]
MKKITTLLFCALLVAGAFAQQPEGVIKKASVAPVLDGVVDEVWAEANVYNIDLPYRLEVPTLGDAGETTWQGLWFEDAMYILLTVTDNDFYPHYSVTPAGASWEYDKPEIYWDVNFVLLDGVGASAGGSGHYQVAPAFADGTNDGTPIDDPEDIGVIYAFMVDDPNYIAEYYVPFTYLLDGDGIGVDLTGTIGFDVTIIDRDEGDAARKRAVWANIGTFDESWSNMDECGLITFEGAEAGVDIESITLTGGDITENNQPLQIVAAILPVDATNKNLSWTVTNTTGKATITSTGLLTPIMDGTVTVTAAAQDLGYESAEIVVTISGQLISLGEINLIRNGFFNVTTATGAAAEWNGTNVVTDGVVSLDPNPDGANYWDFTFTQQTFGCNTTDMYTFSFYLWADATDTVNVDFEDSNNGYNRYGTSTHELANGGESDWTFESGTDPTKYVFDVVFNELVANTRESVQFMIGLHDPVVYIDSVLLYNINDLALLSEPVAVPVTEIAVSSAGDATSVALDVTLQMSAAVTPGDATLGGAWWSVVNGTGAATIDPSTGLLTPVSLGTVTVVATAKDESEITGSKEINVTWATGISKPATTEIKVYPNPVGNELHIVLTSVNEKVTIYNSIGAKMKEVMVSGTEATIDVSGYANGFYFVKAGNAVMKFIK